MKKLIFIAFITISCTSNKDTEKGSVVMTMDFIKIENGNQKEALFFYRNNWKMLREKAKDRGYIKDFSFLKTVDSKDKEVDLVLVTVYKDSSQYRFREENFKKVIEEFLPEGPKFLNKKTKQSFVSTKAWLDAMEIE